MVTKSINSISVIEKLAKYIVLTMNKSLKKQGLELKKMELGINIILLNITKLVIVFVVAAFFNLLKETAFMLFIFAIVRSSAFGLHAQKNSLCTIMSCLLFIFGAYICTCYEFKNINILILFIIMDVLLYKYAPADTESHPIPNDKLRNRLKIKSVLTGILLMIAALTIPDIKIKGMIATSVCFEVISILPITYKIFERKYNNYEECNN